MNEFEEHDKITLKIKDVGPIDNAELNINKINIIGGPNSTGKSTSSKLLYSFLRTNSENKQELATAKLDKELEFLVMAFDTLFHSQRNDTNARTLHREFKHMVKLMKGTTFEQLRHEFYEFKEFYEMINDKLSLSHENNNFNQLSFDEFQKLRAKLTKLNAEKDELLFKNSEVSSENKDKIEKINAELEYIKLKMNNNTLVKSLIVLKSQLSKLTELIEKMDESSDGFFEEAMKSLLSSEFSINEVNDYCYASLYGFLDYPFGFDIDFKNFSFNQAGLFNISNVFYLDAFSFFDFRSYTTDSDSLLVSDHVNSLKKILFESNSKYEMFDSDDENYKIMFNLQKKINEIIGGEIITDNGTLKFVPKDGNFSCSMMNTASGVKQIAMIQTLLSKKAFKPNSFLILDEPEVNLHPEWQFKLAQILVLLAIVGNVRLYINTHSPLFISCIDTFTRYYEVTDSVNYYLTVPSKEQLGKYNVVDVPCDNLESIFNNLGHPYDRLDMIDIKIYHKQEDSEFDEKE